MVLVLVITEIQPRSNIYDWKQSKNWIVSVCINSLLATEGDQKPDFTDFRPGSAQ